MLEAQSVLDPQARAGTAWTTGTPSSRSSAPMASIMRQPKETQYTASAVGWPGRAAAPGRGPRQVIAVGFSSRLVGLLQREHRESGRREVLRGDRIDGLAQRREADEALDAERAQGMHVGLAGS